MELSELTAYAGEKYHIREQHNWADLPGLSVLCHPETGKWIAVLMREWSSETGGFIEKCDLKCGRDSLLRPCRPYLSSSFRMYGSKWIGITFDRRTEPDTVFQLFDKAVASETPQGYTVVIDPQRPAAESACRETPLPFAGNAYPDRRESIPGRLREMRRLYEYGRESEEARAKNFYRQAVFMQDYEDDAPWAGEFTCYFPTYHDLTLQQLRGYFTWRTQLRKGVFSPISASCAYIYLYELLNGVGAASPEDVPAKLKAFETGYLDAGLGDKRMRQNLHRWMLEYAVVHALPPETARGLADPDMLERDAAVAVLKAPAEHTDEEVFAALCMFGDKKNAASPVLAADPARGRRLFSEVWRAASAYRSDNKNLFTLCFGRRKVRRWYPLANAVIHWQSPPENREYILNGYRAYTCKNGVWQVSAYDTLSFDKSLFAGLLHETDARLRRYLKTGRYLKEFPADAWAIPYIDAVIGADTQEQIDAARPKITIDLSGLEKIRREAAVTRDSLLVEEEPEDTEEADVPAREAPAFAAEAPAPEGTDAPAEPEGTGLPLGPVQIRILRTLLEGGDVPSLLREHHLMPSVTADFINEALFDEIGDNVLLCEDGILTVVEDYTEDLEQLLGGTVHG